MTLTGEPHRLRRLILINLRALQQRTGFLMIAICALGVVLRLWRYAANRSLWFDEALLALNIVHRSFAGLLQPLDNNQGAPIAFLFSEKALINLFGNKDYVLRLFPLAAGIAAIFLMWKVLEEYVGGVGAKIALLLFAVSEPLIYYASEVKQYCSDVLACLWLLALAPRLFDTRTSPTPIVLFGVVAGILVWFSHPAIFVISAIFAVLFWDALLRRDAQESRWRRLSWIGAAALLPASSFLLLFVASLRFIAKNSALLNYWEGAFMPLPAWQNVIWFLKAWYSLLNNLVGLPLLASCLATILVVLGCRSLLARRWQLIAVLVTPLVIALAASGLHKYPFSGRLMLFSVPILLLIIAEGIEWLRSVIGKMDAGLAPGVTTGLAVFILYAPVSVAVVNFLHPPMKEDIKPVMSYLHRYRAPGDVVYVYHGAVPAFEYYAAMFGFQKNDYIAGTPSSERPDRYLRQIERIKGGGRFWLIFSHNCENCQVNEEEYFIEQLDKFDTRLVSFRAPGASVYSYAPGLNSAPVS